ncbi:putative neuraminidase [Acidipila rosea]|uniref:Putative neuraminidase n=2 Tax=Acidipila rosea TaxID=768535 RepID=A0A4V2PVV7_9BACT|nr:putative neuraminidase [Acidipila rosea]
MVYEMSTERTQHVYHPAYEKKTGQTQVTRQPSAAARLAATAALLLVFCLAPALARAQMREFIYTSAPFPSAHASTLVELKNGDYLAAWFGGTAEGQPDVAIWSSRRTASGWSAPVELAREANVPTWNPVLFHAKNGRLWLYYKFGPRFTWWTAARRYSDDEGRTWSPIQHLPAGIYGPIRAKPLVLPSGVIVSGTSVESYSSWAAWVERSVDNGLTWTRIGPVTLPQLQAAPQVAPPPGEKELEPVGIIQPVIVSLGGSHLRLYARSSSQIGRICVADSKDLGRTWSAARPLDLPNPNSGIDLVRLRDGRIVLIYNDTSTGRTPLNLAVSTDGEHFHNFAVLESSPGEFSYPALIQGSDGNLHITYTYNRKRIRYVVYPLSQIPR